MKYIKFFEEANINLLELNKLKGVDTRGQVLVNKLSSNEPKLDFNKGEQPVDLMLNINGEWVIPSAAIQDIQTNGSYDSDKAKQLFLKNNRYKDVFKSGTDTYKLNQVKKTPDFGSSGPGVLTKKYEIIQSLFIAYKITYPNLDLTTSNISSFLQDYKQQKSDNAKKGVLKRIGLHIDIDVISDEDILELSNNKDWFSTFTRVPEALWNMTIGRNRVFSTTGKYLFFHITNKDIDSPVFKLTKKFNSFTKGVKIGFPKFCPADLWVVKANALPEINRAIDSCVNINDLITLVDMYFGSIDMIPISLKKVLKGESFKIIVNRTVGKKLPDFYIKSFMLADDPFKGAGTTIVTKSVWTSENPVPGEKPEELERVVKIDSSEKGKAIDAEITGKSSKQGKISFDAINRIINTHRAHCNLIKIDTLSELKRLSIEQLKVKIQTHYDILTNLRLVNVNIAYQTATRLSSKGKEYQTRLKTLTTEHDFMTKLQALQVTICIAQVYMDSPIEGNKLMTSLIRYALSIQTDIFDTTPKYLRVI